MSKLFTPVRVGAFDSRHRVVRAPLTRMRSDMPGNVQGPLMREYYRRRAAPGGLLIAERPLFPAREMTFTALPISRTMRKWRDGAQLIWAC